MARSNIEGCIISGVQFGAPSTGALGGMLSVPSTTVVALGSIQTDAAALNPGFTLVTGANNALGVRLPPAQPGLVVIIKNSNAATLKVWPASGDAINALSADAVFNTAATAVCFQCIAYDSVTWYTLPTVPS